MLLEEKLLEKIKSVSTETELLLAAKYLNILYNIFTPDEQLWDEIKKLFHQKYNNIFDEYSHQIIANRFINELLLRYYPCERTVKYAIVNSLKSKHDTVLFEMPVLDSRIDVCRINGKSFAYEIKTEFDNFKRLKKQLSDYSKIYEYVFVVIPPKFYEEILKIIPNHCGIKIFKHEQGKSKITFYTKRKAIKSPELNARLQLECLSKEILEKWLLQKKVKKIPPFKEGRINLILEKYCVKTINTDFKHFIKQLYKENWEFILNNYYSILPIDIQAFFSNILDPKLLYLKENN